MPTFCATRIEAELPGMMRQMSRSIPSAVRAWLAMRSSRFRSEAFTPARLVDEERQLDLVLTVDLPGQQAAPSEKGTGTPFHGSPKTEAGMIGVPIAEPLELLLGFIECARSVRKVASDFGVAIELEQRAQVLGHEVA